jgi:hypothetical protein
MSDSIAASPRSFVVRPKPRPKIVKRPKLLKQNKLGRVVIVRLSPEDYENAATEAKSCNQTLSDWISGMVNISLQP